MCACECFGNISVSLIASHAVEKVLPSSSLNFKLQQKIPIFLSTSTNPSCLHINNIEQVLNKHNNQTIGPIQKNPVSVIKCRSKKTTQFTVRVIEF
jgi:hypothetical protein